MIYMKIIKVVDYYNSIEKLHIIRTRLINEFSSVNEIDLYLNSVEAIDDKITQVLNELKEEINMELAKEQLLWKF